MPRCLAAILLFLLAGPSLLFAQQRPASSFERRITATALSLPARRFGPLEIIEAWHLTSPHDGFGGVSAMTVSADRRFTLLSDIGTAMRFRLTDAGRISDVRIARVAGNGRRKWESDIESVWHDSHSGRLWLGYEGTNRIARLSPGLQTVEAEARPRDMRRWSSNGGAEALVRLGDGRWLVLAEKARTRTLGTAGLLFAGDPTAPATPPPVRFGYQSWGMGAVTDAADLPDGRVLLLHRQIGPWTWFTSTLAIGDPAAIRPIAAWTARPLAAIGEPVMSENFEAVAVLPHPRGLSIWLASDDNFSPWQRTLLLHLLLPARAIPPR